MTITWDTVIYDSEEDQGDDEREEEPDEDDFDPLDYSDGFFRPERVPSATRDKYGKLYGQPPNYFRRQRRRERAQAKRDREWDRRAADRGFRGTRDVPQHYDDGSACLHCDGRGGGRPAGTDDCSHGDIAF